MASEPEARPGAQGVRLDVGGVRADGGIEVRDGALRIPASEGEPAESAASVAVIRVELR